MTCDAQVIPEPEADEQGGVTGLDATSSFMREIARGMLAAEVLPE